MGTDHRQDHGAYARHVSVFLDRLGVSLPVVQAGLGGGLADHRLAAAVSDAGGLGTIGMFGPEVLASEIESARALTDKPVGVNLLLPFTRRAHLAVACRADVVTTFWGTPRRPGPAAWIHQCGSVEEALAAYAAGADAVIVQGVEAGGHVRGSTGSLELLERTLAALPRDFPVLVAGGIADATDVREALAAGATAAVAGTRFLMSEESRASAAYKARLVDGRDTVLTELFGLGWPGAHRVLPNRATDRWLGDDPRGPRAARVLNRLTAPLLARAPDRSQLVLMRRQAVNLPLYSPLPSTAGTSPDLLEVTPLYAGETVARIHDIRPAGDLVRDLAP
jgi:NAD(P)H-dependent flavin oxidoreductase YrpB (nitropropane dioxygenase family)